MFINNFCLLIQFCKKLIYDIVKQKSNEYTRQKKTEFVVLSISHKYLFVYFSRDS